jgi:hypothetical protein
VSLFSLFKSFARDFNAGVDLLAPEICSKSTFIASAISAKCVLALRTSSHSAQKSNDHRLFLPIKKEQRFGINVQAPDKQYIYFKYGHMYAAQRHSEQPCDVLSYD